MLLGACCWAIDLVAQQYAWFAFQSTGGLPGAPFARVAQYMVLATRDSDAPDPDAHLLPRRTSSLETVGPDRGGCRRRRTRGGCRSSHRGVGIPRRRDPPRSCTRPISRTIRASPAPLPGLVLRSSSSSGSRSPPSPSLRDGAHPPECVDSRSAGSCPRWRFRPSVSSHRPGLPHGCTRRVGPGHPRGGGDGIPGSRHRCRHPALPAVRHRSRGQPDDRLRGRDRRAA